MNRILKVIRIAFSAVAGMAYLCQYAEAAKRKYDVPEGPAAETLPVVAEQGHLELVYAADVIKDVSTHSVQGRLSAQTALNRMFEGTPLEVVPASKGNAFGIVRISRANDKATPETETTNQLKNLEDSKDNMTNPLEKKPIKRFMLALLASFPTSAIAQGQDSEGDDVYTLESILVRPIEEGAEAALARQRNSNTITNVISEETLDYLPDASIGEALQRLSGISMAYDRGEPNTITIRGAGASLNNINVNGDRIPSPGSSVSSSGNGSRTASLSNVPAALISEIEVTKAIRPDQDSDSVGGNITLRTKKATDLRKRVFESQLAYQYGDMDGVDGVSAEFTYGDRVGDDGNFGYIISASHEDRDSTVHETGMDWTRFTELQPLTHGEDPIPLASPVYAMDNIGFMHREIFRERSSVNLNLDFKASENAHFSIGGFYNFFDDGEVRRRFRPRWGNSARLIDVEAGEDGVSHRAVWDGGRVRRQVRPGLKQTETYGYNFEGIHNFSDWNFDYRASYISSDRSFTRTQMIWEYRTSDDRDDGLSDRDGIIDTIVDTSGDLPTWENPTGFYRDLSKAAWGRRGSLDLWHGEYSQDEATTVQANVERFFTLGEGQLELKAGFKSRGIDRTMQNARHNYRWLGRGDEQVFMTDYLKGDGRAPYDTYGVDLGVLSDPDVFQDAIFNTLAQSPNFRENWNNRNDDYSNDETVDALYMMGTYNKGPMTLLAGVRREDTDSASTGRSRTRIVQWDPNLGENGEQVTVLDDRVEITSKSSYDNDSPAAIGIFELNRNTVLRAAWTNTIGRPSYNQYAPLFNRSAGTRQPEDDGTEITFLSIGGGNPNLSAYESENIDLSLEFYFGDTGIFSVGYFQKDISNFISSVSIEDTEVPVSSLPEDQQAFFRQASNSDIVDEYSYFYSENLRSAELDGFEVAYRQKFGFLPDGWDNFGMDMNFSLVDGEEELDDGSKRGFLQNQFDEVINLQVFYETDKYSARMAWNHHGPLYHRVRADAWKSRADGQNSFYDFSFQYRFNDRGADRQWSMFFDIKNVFDDLSSRRIFGGYDGVPEMVASNETAGRTWIIGAKLKM